MKRISFPVVILFAALITAGCFQRQSLGTYPAASQNATQNQLMPVQPGTISSPATSPVPAEYRSIYDGLDTGMDIFEARLKQDWDGSRSQTVLAAELLYANGNIGPTLLSPEVLDLNRSLLLRLHDMGVKGVVLAIKYPLLSPDFPSSSEYLRFYKNITAECRRYGMKVLVEDGAVFAGTPYSPIKVDWSKYSAATFLQALQDQLLLTAHEVQPDYLTLANEPSTEEQLTGLSISPTAWSSFISSTLSKIDRSRGTLLGAGTGTWENPDYINSIMNMTGLDYIDLHVYPFGLDNVYLNRALDRAKAARAAGKRVTVSEAWLYKALPEELGMGGLGLAEKIMDRDFYSFWEPLDARFIGMMADFADATGMDFVSFFWSRHFFAYLDYPSTPHNLSTAELNRLINRAGTSAVSTGKLSPLGEYYRNLLLERTTIK